MSVQTQIDRIGQNVANTYAVLSALGADMPTEQNTDNLAETAGSAKAVLYSEQTLTEEQQTQARENIGASPLKKYGKLVVFGDSLGEGSNNGGYSFVDVLSESGVFSSVVKACRGSATIGPYNTDSYADGYSLTEQLETYATDVANADIIICEYGANDISAMTAGVVEAGSMSDDSTAATVCGYIRKAMARIYELNPDAAVHWIYPYPLDFESVKKLYPTDLDKVDNILLFNATALKVARDSGALIMLPMCCNPNLLSSDGAHPNTDGHRLFAEWIVNGLYSQQQLPTTERIVTLGGDTDTMTNLTVDSAYANLVKLMNANVPVKLLISMSTYGGTIMTGACCYANSYAVAFNGVVDDRTNTTSMTVIVAQDDSVSAVTNTFSSSGGGADLTPTSGSGEWSSTYADTSDEYNTCTYVKSCNVVSVQLQVTMQSTVSQTWQELTVARGLPPAVEKTAGMAFYQGYFEFLQIIVDTAGDVKVLPMSSAASKTIRGQLVYIAAE